MRTPRRTLFIVITVLLVVSSLDAKFATIGDETSQPLNLAILVEGRVGIKRQGWSNYAPLAFGAELRPGDLLQIPESSQMQVVCADLTLHSVAPGLAGVPCNSPEPVLRRPDDSLMRATRGKSVDGSFPVVLTPRATKVLSSTPNLRWTAVPGAKQYSVVIRGIDFEWTYAVPETEMVYPSSAPPLKPGVAYKLIVETGGKSSSEEAGLGLGFSILDSYERAGVLEGQKQIERLGLRRGPTEFLLAHLYATHGLNADAIQTLEALSSTFKVAAVRRFLGDLYCHVGLFRKAEDNYLSSLSLSEAGGDQETQLLAHAGLARIYAESFGNTTSAIMQLDAASATAKSLGATSLIRDIDERVALLRKTGTGTSSPASPGTRP